MSAQVSLLLCRNLTVIPVADRRVLETWARWGRVHPDDYLVNPQLETCLQAKEVPELERIFRRSAAQRLAKMSWVLALGFTVLFIAAMTGS